MLFRRSGIRHTDYAADRALFPIPADRWAIGAMLLLVALVHAIFVFSPPRVANHAASGEGAST